MGGVSTIPMLVRYKIRERLFRVLRAIFGIHRRSIVCPDAVPNSQRPFLYVACDTGRPRGLADYPDCERDKEPFSPLLVQSPNSFKFLIEIEPTRILWNGNARF